MNPAERLRNFSEQPPMSEHRRRTEEMISALKQQRDQLALRIHLAGTEAKEEWSRLDERLNQLVHRVAPLRQAGGETAEDVWESLKLVGEEVRQGFEKIRKAL